MRTGQSSKVQIVFVIAFAMVFPAVGVFGSGAPGVKSPKPCNCNKLKTEAQAFAALCADELKFGKNSKRLFSDNLSVARVLTSNRKAGLGEPFARKAIAQAQSNIERAEANALLGWNLSEQNRHSDSARAFEASLQLRALEASKRKPDEKQLEATSMQMQQLAAQYRKENQPAKAKAMMNKAADTMETAHGKDHVLSKLAREMAKTAP